MTGFADDTVITARSPEKALRVVELTQKLFQEIGLEVNPRKSIAVNITKGRLTTSELVLSNRESIRCIDGEAS